jgi:hypothetical protein
MQMQQQQAAQQQQQMQQEQAVAQSTAIKDMNSGSQMAGLQGADLRSGGMSAAQTAPNENRNSTTGQTDTGQPML